MCSKKEESFKLLIPKKKKILVYWQNKKIVFTPNLDILAVVVHETSLQPLSIFWMVYWPLVSAPMRLEAVVKSFSGLLTIFSKGVLILFYEVFDVVKHCMDFWSNTYSVKSQIGGLE